MWCSQTKTFKIKVGPRRFEISGSLSVLTAMWCSQTKTLYKNPKRSICLCQCETSGCGYEREPGWEAPIYVWHGICPALWEQRTDFGEYMPWLNKTCVCIFDSKKKSLDKKWLVASWHLYARLVVNIPHSLRMLRVAAWRKACNLPPGRCHTTYTDAAVKHMCGVWAKIHVVLGLHTFGLYTCSTRPSAYVWFVADSWMSVQKHWFTIRCLRKAVFIFQCII